MSIRIDKIAELLKEELSLIFLYKIQDPALGMLTVTGVKVSPDLKNAKVYISIYEKDGRQTKIAKLNDIKGYIRTQLASKVNHLRNIPDLDFYLDDTQDYVEKIEDIFKKIHKDDN